MVWFTCSEKWNEKCEMFWEYSDGAYGLDLDSQQLKVGGL